MTGIAALAPTATLPADLLGGLPQAGGARSIEQTGRQFESLFLSMLLKEMRQTLGSDGLFAGDSSDIHGGLFDLYLGKHIADSGGVGLADAISRMMRTSGVHANPTTGGSSTF